MVEPNRPVPDGCPPLETLGAYVDGTLAGGDHEAVQAHLATCDDCLELVAETTRAVSGRAEPATGTPIASAGTPPQTLSSDSPPPTVLPFRRRRLVGWLMTSGVAAAAVLAAVAWVQPEWWDRLRGGGPDAQLAELRSVQVPERLPAGRLVGFSYAPVRPVVRSGSATPQTDNLDLLTVAARVQEAAERRPSPGNRRAQGVALLSVGLIDDAIETLESVVAERPADAGLLNDLGAAYVSRASRTGDHGDAAKALAVLDRALRLAPAMEEAHFNRAMALALLGRDEDAKAVWAEVIRRDTSEWRKEAVLRMADLESPPPPPR